MRESVSCSVVCDSWQPHGLWLARLLCPWDAPGQNTGVGSLSLLQGIFPTQGSNPGLPYCRRILHQLCHQGSPLQPVPSVEQFAAAVGLVGCRGKCGRSGGLDDRSLRSRFWSLGVSRVGFSEAALRGSWTAGFPLNSPGLSLCLCPNLLFHEAASHIGSGFTLMAPV